MNKICIISNIYSFLIKYKQYLQFYNASFLNINATLVQSVTNLSKLVSCSIIEQNLETSVSEFQKNYKPFTETCLISPCRF